MLVAIDVVGLMLTVFMTGIRYPHYVLLSALLHEAGQLLMAMITQGHIEKIVAAGAFGIAQIASADQNVIGSIILFSGPLTNFIVGSIVGGIECEKPAHFFNPAAQIRHPFAVTNLRVALLSLAYTIWHVHN